MSALQESITFPAARLVQRRVCRSHQSAEGGGVNSAWEGGGGSGWKLFFAHKTIEDGLKGGHTGLLFRKKKKIRDFLI